MRGKLLEAGKTRLGLGLAALRVLADPFKFLLDGLLARRFGGLFLLEARLLLLEPGAVVALPGNTVATIKLEDPLGGVVKEVSVVGDRDHGPGESGEELLQPLDTFGVEVVGGFVKQQHIRLGKQKTAKRHAALLAARKIAHHRIPGRETQRVGRDFHLGLDIVRPA